LPLRFSSYWASPAALPLNLPRREPAPEAQKILMVDFVDIQARVKEAASSANYEEGKAGVAATKTPNVLLSFTVGLIGGTI
jgi:hypothetical protein